MRTAIRRTKRLKFANIFPPPSGPCERVDDNTQKVLGTNDNVLFEYTAQVPFLFGGGGGGVRICSNNEVLGTPRQNVLRTRGLTLPA